MDAAGPSFAEKAWHKFETFRQLSRVALKLLPGGTFQLGQETIRGVPTRVFKNLPASLGDYYRGWFQRWADREWLIYEGERYTFGRVERLYEGLGNELFSSHGWGLKKGDKVGICMRNYPELLIAFLGVTAAGGVAVPLNSLWKSEELEYAVNDAGCKVIIADPERMDLCSRFADKLGFRTILVRGDKSHPASVATNATMWNDIVSSGVMKGPLLKNRNRPTSQRIVAEDEAMIMYTSGSTGFPKGVVHTHRSVGTAMKCGEMVSVAMPEPDAVQLMSVPLFHITALCPIALFSIPMGSKVIMMRKWRPGQALQLIEDEKVTRFTGVPTMMLDLMEHADWSPERVKTLKGVIAGGAPVPPSQVRKLRKKSKRIQSGQGYGLTETMALGCVIRGADCLMRPTSCGKPVPLIMEVAIIDPETGREVPTGQRGEVCLRGATIMKGYHNKPEKTAKALDKNGYFHSGDIGKKDSAGFVYILDRMKDLIIRGGENIDCSEVEAALLSHPAVRECSVFGLPDERLGEVVGAAIWCVEEVSPEDLRKHASSSLANFKIPSVENIFYHSEALPRGATGKLNKKGMRDRYSDIVKQRAPRARL